MNPKEIISEIREVLEQFFSPLFNNKVDYNIKVYEHDNPTNMWYFINVYVDETEYDNYYDRSGQYDTMSDLNYELRLTVKGIIKKYLGFKGYVDVNPDLLEHKKTKMTVIISESQYLRLISENFENQKYMINDLLKSFDFDGVIRYEFSSDEENPNEVTDVFVIFDLDWESDNIFARERLVNKTKIQVRDIIKKWLGLNNVYVGSYFEKTKSY